MGTMTLDSMSQGDLLIMLLFVCVASVVLGFLTDMLMGASGFGPIGNGSLIALGGAVGAYYRSFVFGVAAAQHAYTIVVSAIGMATLILLFFGFAKRMLKG